MGPSSRTPAPGREYCAFEAPTFTGGGFVFFLVALLLVIPFRTVQIGLLETMEDALLWVARNQMSRRNLTPYMRAELALMSKEALMKAAFENQSAWWAKDGKIPDIPVPPNLAEPEPIDTRQEVAKLAGLSNGTISKVERIQKSAAPAVVEAVRKGEVSIDAAAHVADLPIEEQEAAASKGHRL